MRRHRHHLLLSSISIAIINDLIYSVDATSQTIHEHKVYMSERQILEKLYDDCGGYNWENNENWMSGESICDWEGIKCLDGTDESIESIYMGYNNLKCIPPFEILHLPNLKSLTLYGNDLDGFSFDGIEYAKNLSELHLGATGIDTIGGIGKAPNLKKVDLSSNELSGKFPHELTELSSLEYLSVSDNFLTGELPDDLDKMTSLESLLLGSNSLSGDLSKALPSSLKLLDVSQNELTGSIPSSFLENVLASTELDVDLSDNELTGVVPASLKKFDLLSIFLDDNLFSGIDKELCAMKNWNDGDVGRYGCDGLLCPAGHWSPEGRQSSEEGCKPCSTSTYYGSSECESSASSSEISSTTVSSGPVSLSGSAATPPIHEHKVYMSERQVLEKLYEECEGDDWVNNENWMSGESICDWEGIKCAEGVDDTVETIHLGSNDLKCIPPFEILHLPNLKVLSLYGNELDGFSFDGIEYAKNLSELYLDATGIDSIGGIGKAPNLRKVDLGFNKLSGKFPHELTELSSLTFLSLADNSLSGELPDDLAKMSGLETLLLGSNSLSGDLSKPLPPSLKILELARNDLTGSIPSSFLENVPSSVKLDVDLSDNQLTGVIPSFLIKFDALNIQLNDNLFSGIDEELCMMKNWNDGDVGRYGCDGLLCPSFKSATEGRQSSENEECEPCPTSTYYGSSECVMS